MRRIALAISGAALLAAAPARADHEDTATPKESSRLAIVMALPFLIADGVYASRPSWAAPGWALSEVFNGGVYVSVCMANATHDQAGFRKTAWTWGVLGFGMLLHGTLSIVLWELPGTRARDRPRVSWDVGPGRLAIDARF